VPVSTPATRRHGGTLVELLVALPLAALVAVLAVATLIGGWRLNRRVAATQGSAREFRHAQATFEAELRPLRARDIHTVSDTALEFDALLGVGVVCAATGATATAAAASTAAVELASADSRDPRGIGWASLVRAGDRLSLWNLHHDTLTSLVEWHTTARASQWGAACATSPWMAQWADRRTVRLTLASAPSAPVVVGAAMAVRRRTQLALYRSGTAWYLGRRTRTNGTWEVIQPVAGPFVSASQGGLTVQLLDARGARTDQLSNVAAVHVELRADHAPNGHTAPKRDTAAFQVILRGESGSRPH
jgi:hypothetical protein